MCDGAARRYLNRYLCAEHAPRKPRGPVGMPYEPSAGMVLAGATDPQRLEYQARGRALREAVSG